MPPLRPLLAGFLVLAVPSFVPALAQVGGAKALLLAGKYAEARTAVEQALAAAPADAALVRLQARILFESGGWDKALEVCASGPAAKDPSCVAVAGEIHLRRGQHDKAIEVLSRCASDHWCQALTALVHRARGRAREATVLFDAIVQQVDQNKAPNPDLWALGAAQRELGHFQASMNALVKAQQNEPDDSRAAVMIGQLFVTKYQITDAMKELDRALEKNPHHAMALAHKAELLADHGRFEEAQQTAKECLAVNAQLSEPHLVRAKVHEYEENYDAMLADLAGARKLAGDAPEVLAREAVARWLRDETAAFAAAERACLTVKPDHAQLYCDLGSSCSVRRRTDDAFRFFQQALKMDPDLAEAESELGNLHMREGNEEQARVHLERAWKLDEFNYRTKNFLELLDYIDRDFLVRLSPSFVFKVDEAREGFLADVFLPEMERFYPDLCKRYGWTPKERVIVELFPANDWFAARISGTPWIGITGGCFGRVIAAESPRVNPGTSHRTEVLRHEITHAINLQQTNRKLPMWLAEGLAVQEEHSAGGPMWPALLRRGLGVGDLLPVSNLNAGFTRAKNMAQRQLAYYQASLVVAELKRRFGFDKVLALLVRFGEGKTQVQTFQEVMGLDAAALDALGMEAWKAASAASPRRAAYHGDEDLAELKKRAGDGAPWATGELLWGLMTNGRAMEAVPVVKQLAAPAKTDAGLAALVGDFLRSRNHEEKARKYYQTALAVDPKCYLAHMGLAKMAQAASDAKSAQAHLEAAAAAHPSELEPHQELRKIHALAGDKDKERLQVQWLAKLDLHQAEPWLHLARIEVARKDWKAAREALTELISIDTYSAELHSLRATVAEETGDREGALAAWTVHWRLQVYPYQQGSKTGAGLDRLKAAVTGGGSLKELGAVMAADRLGSKEAANWLAEVARGTGEVAHRAALALSAGLEPRALNALIAALGCKGPGQCGERAREALRRLTGRGLTTLLEWQTWARTREKRPREDWVLESLEHAGYKAQWGEPAEEIPVLLKALEARDWWLRENAWRELSRSAKFSYGRGAFGPETAGLEKDYATIRKEAAARFQAWWNRYRSRL